MGTIFGETRLGSSFAIKITDKPSLKLKMISLTKKEASGDLNPFTKIEDRRPKVAAAKGLSKGELNDYLTNYNSKVWGAKSWWEAELEFPAFADLSLQEQVLYAGELSELFKDGAYGFVVSCRGIFKDLEQRKGSTGLSPTKPDLGSLSISGLAFGDACGQRSRHGLEAVLLYYYYRSISSSLRPGEIIEKDSFVSIQIGETVFRQCWLTELSFEPHDLNFNLWSWSMLFRTHPNFVPKPIFERF